MVSYVLTEEYRGKPQHVSAVFVPGTGQLRVRRNVTDDLCQWRAFFGNPCDSMFFCCYPLCLLHSPTPACQRHNKCTYGFSFFSWLLRGEKDGEGMVGWCISRGPLSIGQQWHLIFVLSLLSLPQACICVILPGTSHISQDLVSLWNSSLG